MRNNTHWARGATLPRTSSPDAAQPDARPRGVGKRLRVARVLDDDDRSQLIILSDCHEQSLVRVCVCQNGRLSWAPIKRRSPRFMYQFGPLCVRVCVCVAREPACEFRAAQLI